MLKLTQETRFLSSGPPSLSPPPQFVLAYLSITTRLLWALAPAADSRCSSQDISAAFVSLRVPKMAPLMTNKSQVQSQHISLGHPSYIFFSKFIFIFFLKFISSMNRREGETAPPSGSWCYDPPSISVSPGSCAHAYPAYSGRIPDVNPEHSHVGQSHGASVARSVTFYHRATVWGPPCSPLT